MVNKSWNDVHKALVQKSKNDLETYLQSEDTFSENVSKPSLKEKHTWKFMSRFTDIVGASMFWCVSCGSLKVTDGDDITYWHTKCHNGEDEFCGC